MSVGIASGRHLLLVENKGGFDALSATYANMAIACSSTIKLHSNYYLVHEKSASDDALFL